MALFDSRSLSRRDRQPEVMDQPGLDPDLHRDALLALERINRISRTSQAHWPEIAQLAHRHTERPLRVLDIACGGGDVACAVARIGRRRGVDLEIAGCDLSSEAIARAQERARKEDLDIDFFQCDVTADRLPESDAMICSLFLHHLTANQIVALLRSLAAPPCRLVQVSDLVRSRLGHAYAYAGSRLLTRSPVVHVDALLSVRAALTRAEVGRLAERAELTDAVVRRQFPQRFLLTWKRGAA